jgi:histidinol phosphatase-like PHP family hydrolase
MLAKGNNFLRVPQDLHIHTVFSVGDGAIVSQQTIPFIAKLRHAEIIGISDHFECLSATNLFEQYFETVRSNGLHVGTEIDGGDWAKSASLLPFEYFVYHCRDREEDYKGIDILLSTNKPVIIAHPQFLGTNLHRVPSEAYVEINNRYVWRSDWRNGYMDFLSKFRFVINSDAHQPNWLNQNIARFVAGELGVKETLLFAN